MRTTAQASRFTTKRKGGRRRLSVCDECPRPRRGGRLLRLGRGLRTHSRACLLEDGILCCGPATPAGCRALCAAAGAPCIGCRVDAPDAQGFEAVVLMALTACLEKRGSGLADGCAEVGLRVPAGRLREYHQARLLLRRLVAGRRVEP